MESSNCTKGARVTVECTPCCVKFEFQTCLPGGLPCSQSSLYLEWPVLRDQVQILRPLS